jgi:hypothetical protein
VPEENECAKTREQTGKQKKQKSACYAL